MVRTKSDPIHYSRVTWLSIKNKHIFILSGLTLYSRKHLHFEYWDLRFPSDQTLTKTNKDCNSKCMTSTAIFFLVFSESKLSTLSIPAISTKVIFDLMPFSADSPLLFCSTWMVKTQSDLHVCKISKYQIKALGLCVFLKFSRSFRFTKHKIKNGLSSY